MKHDEVLLMEVILAPEEGTSYTVRYSYDVKRLKPHEVTLHVYSTTSWDIAGDIYLAVRKLAECLDEVGIIKLKGFAGFWGDQVLYERNKTDNINGRPEIPDLPF